MQPVTETTQVDREESAETVIQISSSMNTSEDILPQAAPITIETINNELAKQGLGKAVFTNPSGDKNDSTIDTDYFLKLINCSIQMAEKEQKVYLTQALQKRRAAFKAENWAEYEQIVYEMSI